MNFKKKSYYTISNIVIFQLFNATVHMLYKYGGNSINSI